MAKNKALSVREVLKQKKEIIPFDGAWQEAFAQPERYGTWIMYGSSGNGKTSFAMQLCKELSKYGKVAFDSLEEGTSLTMQETLMRFDMVECSNFQILNNVPYDELLVRLRKKGSPDIIVIDSLQYLGLSFAEYKRLKDTFKKKLFVFVSHVQGRLPDGTVAVKIMRDASLKIKIEGFRALSCGRFIGSKGYYTIYPKGAAAYWGEEEQVEKSNPSGVKSCWQKVKKLIHNNTKENGEE